MSVAVAVSINGWLVLRPGDKRLSTGTVPGTKIRLTLRDVCLPFFLALAADYNTMIEPLSLGRNDDGGYAFRTSRESTRWSNHASGTAIDLNWSGHGSRNLANRKWWDLRRNRTATDEIKARYKIVNWGGDWSDRFYDPMHWELKAGTNSAAVRGMIIKLGIDANGLRG